MSDDILIRKSGRAGRITLNRPKALNAVTYDMCMAIEDALDQWRDDDQVALVIIDAVGEKAFSAGGDIAEMYRTASAGDYDYGRKFWADEYRMNARIFNFPKPYVAFMQGFTMGGGVGVSCHGSHRIVGESSRIAMPECGIGLVPDVGGSLLLARAPGRLGEYLGTTGTRMTPGDAIHAGFADYFIPQSRWPDLIRSLENTGEWERIDEAALPAPESPLAQMQADADAHFAGETIHDILRSLRHTDNEFTRATLESLGRQSPLSVACTVELVHRARASDRIERAFEQEYRFTWRAAELGDFVEGIRAAIIDKDRNPRWRHASIDDVSDVEVSRMLMPLGENALKL
ncbi:MAG TPA: enoyl-CoA hydratase/isomerase family protein [Rhodobacteraceae bacterium]|nr:enoyl-CoA hydratase/isomerase family protein [Paracoccaceae bacterium]